MLENNQAKGVGNENATTKVKGKVVSKGKVVKVQSEVSSTQANGKRISQHLVATSTEEVIEIENKSHDKWCGLEKDKEYKSSSSDTILNFGSPDNVRQNSPPTENSVIKSRQSFESKGKENSKPVGVMRNVGSDGHCYFRCISLAFTRSEKDYMKYRHEIVDMLRSTNNIYQSFLNANETLESHLVNMSKEEGSAEIWATEAEIWATSEKYDIDVFVRKGLLENFLMHSALKGETDINHHCDHERDFIALHNENDHYQLVVCDTRPCTCTSNIMQNMENECNIASKLDSPPKDVNINNDEQEVHPTISALEPENEESSDERFETNTAKSSVMESSVADMLREIRLFTKPVDNDNQEMSIETERLSHKLSKLKILYTNADGIKGKVDELKREVLLHKVDMFAITETKVNDLVSNNILFPSGFQIFRQDRKDREGGGVVLAVRDEYYSTLMSIPLESTFSEYVVVKVIVGTEKLNVVVLYNPPRDHRRLENYNRNNEGVIELINKITQISIDNDDRLLIMGDFNHKDINWDELDPRGDESSWSSKLLECTQENLLSQHVKEPTRARGSDQPSILDLIFTQYELDVENIVYQPPLGRSDHVAIHFNYNLKEEIIVDEQKNRMNKGLNYAKADIKGIKQYFKETDWEKLLETESVQDAGDKFAARFLEAVDKFVPVKLIKEKSGKEDWFNKECFDAKQKNDTAWRAYRKKRCVVKWGRYVMARNEYLTTRRRSATQFKRDVAAKCKTHPKLFHKFVRGKLKVKPQILRLRKKDGTLIDNEFSMCQEFNIAFQSVYTVEDSPSPQLESAVKKELTKITVSEGEVLKELKLLDAYKAPGPDNISAYILKLCAEELAKPLTMLYNLSLRKGKVLIQWKIANIAPIFKGKGSRDDPLNYRPVSLTSIVCKVLEKIIRRKVTEHLREMSFFCEGQHGFREGRSTVTNLIEFYEKVCDILQERDGWVDCIFLDFQKAFDSVPHNRLLEKLDKLAGIRGTLKEWIRDYLTDRQQKVVIRGTVSQPGKVTSGVPQGSVLGPLLFLIYINDLPEGIKSFMNMFADDAKLMKRIVSLKCCEELQDDLNKLAEWTATWLIAFNAAKCSVMRMGVSKYRETYQYVLNNTNLRVSECEKDLGILVTPNMSPDKHIAAIVKSTYAQLANIRVAFKPMDLEMFKTIYTTYVRPKLEYAVQFWNPHLKKYEDKIERVQRHATKMVPELRDLSYEERLNKLNLPTLKERRERGDMITTFKFIKGFDDVRSENYFDRRHGTTRGHSQKLRKRAPKQDVSKYFFSNRVVDRWNALKEETIQAKTIANFKKRYDDEQKIKKARIVVGTDGLPRERTSETMSLDERTISN